MLDGRMPMEAMQPVRVKYIKFSSAMDIALLELIQLHNPIAAKHGTRLAMWERVARDFGTQIFDNPNACKWQICRDRGNLLLRWFDEGKIDKLFKDDSDIQNKKKETLLLSLRQATTSKQGSTSPPSPTSDQPHPLMTTPTSSSSPPVLRNVMFPAESPRKLYRQDASVVPPSTASYHLPSLKQQSSTVQPAKSSVMPAIVVREKYLQKEEHPSPIDSKLPSIMSSSRKRKAIDVFDAAAQFVRVVEQKIYSDIEVKRREQQLRAQELSMQHQLLEYLDSSRRQTPQRDNDHTPPQDIAARLYDLMQHKMQFDMQHQNVEMELRAGEIELQRRVVAFLTRC